MENHITELTQNLANELEKLDTEERIAALNSVRKILHNVSPMKKEPVDCVIWVPAESLSANDYNPNSVAHPEMILLEHSIEADGFTQPIVIFETGRQLDIVDGFHRSKVGKESEAVQRRTGGYVPITYINYDRSGRNDRIASTIRHNRARGKHGIEAMRDIVIELAKRNWSDKKIGKELGMDADEVLRLKQIGGLNEIFKDKKFSEAWEIDEEALCETQS